ncbi:universal stress protein [Streptomyces sp. NPDC020898]|uniref:universal stress protein n=1 Tax=Streptomyces sp. NPDC020898 TaxID=3365101 RepID=UPI0037B2C69C
MSRIIAAGLDGSRESLAAVDWAARESLLRDLPCRLVHAWEMESYAYPTAYAPPAGPDLRRHWAERVPREAEEDLRRRYPGLRVSADQVDGQPVPVLLAADADAELLVLGSRGLSGIGGFLVGSVALSVVAHATNPVVLVRAEEPDASGPRPAEPPYGEVVLGLDLRRPADALIEFAFDAAARRASALRVVQGWTPPAYYGLDTGFGYTSGAVTQGLGGELAAQEAGGLTDALRPWREKFPGVEVTENSVIGGAAHHLVEAAAGAGLLVIGRRNRDSAIGTHLGPVAHAVMHHAAAPVAVVPHD